MVLPFSSNVLTKNPAGRDTTAAALTFVIYFLSMYPEVNARLRQEILEKVGPTRRPDYDDIRDMKYLRAVINGEFLAIFMCPLTSGTNMYNCH